MSEQEATPNHSAVKATKYFRENVLRKRSYLQIEWCLEVIANPVERVVQEDGRIRFFGYIPDLHGKALRVVTLEDGETIHNAFPDSGYSRQTQGSNP